MFLSPRRSPRKTYVHVWVKFHLADKLVKFSPRVVVELAPPNELLLAHFEAKPRRHTLPFGVASGPRCHSDLGWAADAAAVCRAAPACGSVPFAWDGEVPPRPGWLSWALLGCSPQLG